MTVFLDWDDPAAPTAKSQGECAAFQVAAAVFLTRLRQELGQDFSIFAEIELPSSMIFA